MLPEDEKYYRKRSQKILSLTIIFARLLNKEKLNY